MREGWPTTAPSCYRGGMALFLFYESPSPEAALREWLRPQPTYLAGSQLAEPKSAKCTPDGSSVISTATSMNSVGSHAMAWTGDVPLSPDSSCAFGSWGGRRSSVATEVTLTGAEVGTEGGGLPSHVLDVDCPLRGGSRGRFTAPPTY